MRLEDKFFTSFFYLFLFGIISSLIIVTSIIILYSDDFLDKNTASEVISIEKRYAQTNINSMNILLSNLVVKIQISLQEQVQLYQTIANDIVNKLDNFNFDKIDILNAYDLREKIKSNDEDILSRLEFILLWFINPEIKSIEQMTPDMRKQLYIISKLGQTMYSIISSNNDLIENIFFIFDNTDLFITYPFKYINSIKFLDTFDNYSFNPSWCTNEQGNIINYYKFKCRDFYKNIMNAQRKTFDLNIDDQNERKVFITPSYSQFGNSSDESVFTICIKFNDIITGQTAYVCSDSIDRTIFSSLDMINENLIGYTSVASVGFNEAFYFPHIMSGLFTKTLGEFIYRLDNNYYLEEKTFFMTTVHKLLTSNYIKYIKKII